MNNKLQHTCPVCNEPKWASEFPIVRGSTKHGERFLAGYDFANCRPCKRAIKAAMPKVSKRKRKLKIAEIRDSYGIPQEFKRWVTGASP